MVFGCICCVVLIGIDGYVVDVEVDVLSGLLVFIIIGFFDIFFVEV